MDLMREHRRTIPVGVLRPEQAAALARDGYLVLRGAAPPRWRCALRMAFEAGVADAARSSVPRASSWRHALVDLDPLVQRVCRVPPLLAAVGQLLQTPFFLSQVEGRQPLPNGGHQALHRDGAGLKAAAALIFLDAFGPENGATRVVPRPFDHGQPDEAFALTLTGRAGDILVFDADLLHGATRNQSGALRRSFLLSFLPETDRAADDACRAVRCVRMAKSEIFLP